MAVFEHSRVAPFGAETILKVVSTFEACIEAVRIELKAQSICRDLNALSASQLNDIGFDHRDLMSNAREIARRSL